MTTAARPLVATRTRRLIVGLATTISVLGVPAYVLTGSSPSWLGAMLWLPLALVLLILWPFWREKDAPREP